MKIDSNQLKKLRIAKNWSQEKVSEACGISLRTVQRLESSGNASIESVRALAAVFDVDPSELMLIEKEKGMTPFEAVKAGFVNFANFSDTASRYEYWWFFLFVLILLAIATLTTSTIFQILALIVVVPLITASMRRLREAGHSHWWLLLFFVPFGQVVVFYLLSMAPNVSLKR